MKEDNEDNLGELWCHYSGMPSVMAYAQKEKVMNKLDKQYTDLLQDILDNGVTKSDRTGTGTISIFGRQIRHKMSEGFPLLTTKKMAFKTIVTELLWFLRGDTNIKYLVDNGCHIWDGDAYKNYLSKVQNYADSLSVPDDIFEFQGVMDSLNKQIKSSVLTQEEFINKIKTDDEFAKKWGDLGKIYGKQWREWGSGSLEDKYGFGKIDQIANLINDLKTNPDSRRLMVSSWNVGELNQMVLPPCHYGFQVYTRELSLDKRYELAGIFGKEKLPGEPSYTEEQQHSLLDELVPKRAISLMWNQRSVDTFLGLPFNIASYGLLLEIIAKAVNMVPDELIGNLGDVHLYSNHIEQAKEQIKRTPYGLPTLKINSGNENWHLLDVDDIVNSLDNDITFKLENYQSHPTIKAPLSN
jgi:thymidylate synthase